MAKFKEILWVKITKEKTIFSSIKETHTHTQSICWLKVIYTSLVKGYKTFLFYDLVFSLDFLLVSLYQGPNDREAPPSPQKKLGQLQLFGSSYKETTKEH